ncbi:MAG: DUF4923 family protein [Candidatus Amulumruptor caecigallinarius]|nr:DUF4923 family protein [Candidatus Amulumruptor caecigallinarius]MCM1396695.1 DUF4923 family protein [Candidatus Amulumruptor caecigallinarius]MCM1453247.1 DUF4923 family protein [bacterium]
MQRILLFITTVALSLSVSAFDLTSLLNGATSTDSTSTAAGSSGGIGDLLGGVASALGLGNTQADAASLAGVWTYKAPAVSFKSENLLKKAGGAAVASAVEAKLDPYYKKAGINNLVVTLNSDSTFTFAMRKVTLSGTYAANADNKSFIFKFKAFGKVSVGQMEGYITLTGNDRMALTFDVSRLIKLVEMAGNLTNSSSIKGISTLLNQYDGMLAGFDLTRSSE